MKNYSLAFVLFPLFFFCFSIPVIADDYKIVTAELPPWSISSEEGIFTEIIAEIEKRMGSEHKPKILPWSRAQSEVKNKQNYLIYPLTRTPNREKNYQWIIEVMPSYILFVTIGGEPMDIEKARNLKRILVQQNSPPFSILKSKGFKNIHATPFGAGNLPKMLESRRGEAWFSAKNIIKFNTKNTPLAGKLVFGPPIIKGMLYLASSKIFSQNVIDDYRKVFKEIKADGTYDMILKKYVGD